MYATSFLKVVFSQSDEDAYIAEGTFGGQNNHNYGGFRH